MQAGALSIGSTLGNVDLIGKARFYASRSSGKLRVVGVVDHSIQDEYNFHASNRALSKAAFQEKKAGRAADFDHKAFWRKRVDFDAKVIDGRLMISNPKWSDAFSAEGGENYGDFLP